GDSGLWDFFHQQMRQAVVRRHLADPAQVAQLHQIIADHLLTLPKEDPLRQGEAMVHLLGQGDRRRAADYYGRIPDPSTLSVLPEQIRAGMRDSSRELAAATQAIADFLLGTLPLDALTEERPDLDARLTWVLSWIPTLEEMMFAEPGPEDKVIQLEGCT